MSQITTISAGVDVSKQTLDIALFPGGQHLRVPYTKQGLVQLNAFIDRYKVKRVGFESSGGYEWRLLDDLRRRCHNGAGFQAAMFQPGQIKAYGTSKLKRAKTDALDAALIAEFTSKLDQMPPLPHQSFDKLLAYMTFLEQIEDIIVLHKTMLESTREAVLRRELEREIIRQKKRRDKYMTLIMAMIGKDKELVRRFDLLCSIRGIAQRTAIAIVVRLPELGQASREEIAALVGVAPYTRESGKYSGQARIAGGRTRLRKSLFMAAFAASKHNPFLKTFYKRLRNAGKTHTKATIATARKLIIIANAVVARNSPWKTDHAN